MKRAYIVLIACLFPTVGELATLAAAEPNWSHNVAEIVYKKCTVCHRPNSSGPFNLVTYDDVQRRADTIAAVLKDEYMPPWKPVDHGIAFANSRRLSAEEERTLKAWIAAGCPSGDLGRAPSPPKFSDDWMLGKPDLVVEMNGKFDVPADGPDIYRSFVFPLQLPEDKWVKAVELRSAAKSSMHHAIFYVDPSGNARKLDGADGKAGMTGMAFLSTAGDDLSLTGSASSNTRLPGAALLRRLRGRLNAEKDEAQAYRANDALARGLGGYVPGSTPNRLPGDLAMLLPRNSDIVMQTHFHPSGKPETEKATIALYFADQPPSQRIASIMIPPMFGFGAKLKIPAGEKNYRITDSFTLPVHSQVIGVSGHAHYICREMKLTATLPHGEEWVLLEIDDWDLDWQDQYILAEPISLPAGSVLRSEIVYDNSADNPENPFHPPREVRWGRGSNDEMGGMTVMTIAQRTNDSPKLHASVRGHFLEKLVNRSNSEMVQMMMQLDDNDDGKLQPTEAPPRMNAQMFRLVDSNRDGGIDADEFARVIRLRGQLRGNGSR